MEDTPPHLPSPPPPPSTLPIPPTPPTPPHRKRGQLVFLFMEGSLRQTNKRAAFQEKDRESHGAEASLFSSVRWRQEFLCNICVQYYHSKRTEWTLAHTRTWMGPEHTLSEEARGRSHTHDVIYTELRDANAQRW